MLRLNCGAHTNQLVILAGSVIGYQKEVPSEMLATSKHRKKEEHRARDVNAGCTFSQRTINEWKKLSNDCVNASTGNV